MGLFNSCNSVKITPFSDNLFNLGNLKLQRQREI